MGHPGSVADSRASSRPGSVDGLLRLSAGNGQPLVGGQPEVPQPQVAQWEVIPQGAGTALLVPASPTATAPVPPILATRADSTASPAREGTPHNRPSRDNSGTLPSEDGRSESGRTWLSRVTDRTKLLREMFELEPTENVLDDFVCALKKRILLQGRMYVFEHYVCFHSNVLGYVKNKIIPLKEVTAVRKRKNVGFPNSIEITWGSDGKREFFTSFLSREDAYRLIMATWAQCSGYANLFTDRAAEADTSASGAGSRRRHRLHGHSTTAADLIATLRSSSDSADGVPARDSFLQKSAKLFHRPVPRRRATDLAIPSAVMAGDGSAGRTSAAGHAAGPETSTASADGPAFRSSRVAKLRTSPGEGASGMEAAYSDDDIDPDPDAMPDLDTSPADVDVDAVDRESTRTMSVDQTDDDDNPSYRNDSDDNSTEPADDQVWTAQPLPAPPINPAMQRLVQGEISGVDVRSFCQTFMADGVPFFIDFHLAKGDEQVQLSPWRNHHNMGRVRELQFVTQLKSRIGPPKAMCYQTQRYTMYQGDVLVYETSQVMPDIPYGDCFTVESRWNVTNMEPAPDGTPRVSVETFVMVDFARSTIWKKAIESGVIASCRSAHEEFIKAAKATAASGNVVSFTSSRAPSLRGSGSLDGGNGKPAAAAGELVIKQRAKAAREAAASSRDGQGSPASQQGESPAPSGVPISEAQLKAFIGQANPDQKRDLLRLLRVSPPGPPSPGRTTSPSFSGRSPSDPGTGPGFRLPAVMEGGAAPHPPVPTAVPAAASRQQRFMTLQMPLLLALGACVVLLQVLILSGWFRPAASAPPATSSSASCSPSWSPARGPADSAASAAVLGSMPGEPLWSGEAGSGGASGWAPYWAGRFELLQQDMQTLQRRMEFLRSEVMAAVSSGRWEPTVTDAASSVKEL